MDLPVNEIICGDCLEVMKGWPDNCVDLVLTDPPYGKQWARGVHGWGWDKSNNEKFESVSWDTSRPPKSAFDIILLVGNNQIIWGGNYFADLFPPSNC